MVDYAIKPNQPNSPHSSKNIKNNNLRSSLNENIGFCEIT